MNHESNQDLAPAALISFMFGMALAAWWGWKLPPWAGGFHGLFIFLPVMALMGEIYLRWYGRRMKGANYFLPTIRILVPLFISVEFCLLLWLMAKIRGSYGGPPVNVPVEWFLRSLTTALGVYFVVLGAVVGKQPRPKRKPGRFIKWVIPAWEFHNSFLFGKSRRARGWFFMIAGVVVVLLSFESFGMSYSAALFGALFAPVAGWAYSYMLWKDGRGRRAKA